MTDLPLLGAIGVTPTYGSGFEKFVGNAIRYMTATRDEYNHFKKAPVNHSVIYVGPMPGNPTPQLVEAWQGGARFGNWDKYGTGMIWLNDVSQLQKDGSLTRLTITPEQRQIIASTAVDCAVKKIGYNYLDFVAIALAQKRLGSIIKDDPDKNPAWVNWALERLSNPHRMICSQLDDYCYNQAKSYLFADDRPFGLVSPEDLDLLKSVS